MSGVERANSKTNSNPLKINTHTRMSSGVKRRQKNSALKALERIKAGGGGGQIKFKGMHAHVAQLKKVDNKLKVMVGASSRPRPLIDGENGVGSGSAGGRTFLQLYEGGGEEEEEEEEDGGEEEDFVEAGIRAEMKQARSSTATAGEGEGEGESYLKMMELRRDRDRPATSDA